MQFMPQTRWQRMVAAILIGLIIGAGGDRGSRGGDRPEVGRAGMGVR